MTDGAGCYRVADLPVPGPYRLVAELQGFLTYTSDSVILFAKVRTINPVLALGRALYEDPPLDGQREDTLDALWRESSAVLVARVRSIEEGRSGRQKYLRVRGAVLEVFKSDETLPNAVVDYLFPLDAGIPRLPSKDREYVLFLERQEGALMILALESRIQNGRLSTAVAALEPFHGKPVSLLLNELRRLGRKEP